jgi:hypothetical protein
MVASWNEILAGFTQGEADQLIHLLAKLLVAMERVVGESAPTRSVSEARSRERAPQ